MTIMNDYKESGLSWFAIIATIIIVVSVFGVVGYYDFYKHPKMCENKLAARGLEGLEPAFPSYRNVGKDHFNCCYYKLVRDREVGWMKEKRCVGFEK